MLCFAYQAIPEQMAENSSLDDAFEYLARDASQADGPIAAWYVSTSLFEDRCYYGFLPALW